MAPFYVLVKKKIYITGWSINKENENDEDEQEEDVVVEVKEKYFFYVIRVPKIDIDLEIVSKYFQMFYYHTKWDGLIDVLFYKRNKRIINEISNIEFVSLVV